MLCLGELTAEVLSGLLSQKRESTSEIWALFMKQSVEKLNRVEGKQLFQGQGCCKEKPRNNWRITSKTASKLLTDCSLSLSLSHSTSCICILFCLFVLHCALMPSSFSCSTNYFLALTFKPSVAVIYFLFQLVNCFHPFLFSLAGEKRRWQA